MEGEMRAEALYRAKIKELDKLVWPFGDSSAHENGKAIIFAACILAEAIRNEFDDTEKVVVPEIKP